MSTRLVHNGAGSSVLIIFGFIAYIILIASSYQYNRYIDNIQDCEGLLKHCSAANNTVKFLSSTLSCVTCPTCNLSCTCDTCLYSHCDTYCNLTETLRNAVVDLATSKCYSHDCYGASHMYLSRFIIFSVWGLLPVAMGMTWLFWCSTPIS